MKTSALWAMLSCAVLLLAGCPQPQEVVEDTPPEETVQPTTPAVDTGPIEQEAVDPLLSELVIYFDFDKSNIRSEFNELIVAHGRNLAEHPNVSLRLDGHADERGTREYNVGLGERRAQSVRQALLLQGASASQLTTLSFGEETPAAIGTGEAVWRLNRRVEFVYE